MMNNKIKLRLSSIVLGVILLTTQSCDTEFLDKKPISTITDANFFATASDALSAVIAVYDVLQWEFDEAGGGGWHSHMLWMFDICSDDADKGGQNDNDVKVLLDLSKFQGNSSAVVLMAPWNISYTGIARANFALENINQMQLTDATFVKNKPRYIAELKFLRALFYFNLVKMYGGVPKITSLLKPSEYNMPRSTEAEIWQLIETDFLESVDALPTKAAIATSEYGRATKDAAYAFLAKVYLFQKKWQQAKDAAEKVINTGTYSLIDNYEQIFEVEGEHGKGSVFEVNYTNKIGGGWPPNSSEGSVLHTFLGSREDTRYEGWGWYLPSDNLYKAYETNDYRREATIAKPGETIYTRVLVGSKPYYSRKYIIPLKDFPAASLGDTKYLGPINLRLMRYEDVLLMHAEASAKVGDEATARTSLNLVRARARRFAILKNATLAGQASLLPDRASTGDQLIQDIWHERRVELAMEGHRFFDLVRQGRAGTVLRAYGKTSFVDGVHEKFGIPLTVIQRTNGGVQQSPGCKNMKKILMFVMAAFVYYGCPPASEPEVDTSPKSRFTVTVSATNYLTFTFTNESVNAESYAWDFGDGTTSTEKVPPAHTYPVPATYPKTYTIKLTVKKGTVEHSSTSDITIKDPGAPTNKDILTGRTGTDKVWKLLRDDVAFWVAPQDNSQYWWGFSKADLSVRKSLFLTEYVFTQSGTFKIKVDATAGVWVEAGVISADSPEGGVPVASLDKNKDGVDIKPWAGGSNFTFTWEDKETKLGTAVYSIADLKVAGLGTYIGLPKASGDGSKEYPSAPTSATTFHVKEVIDGGTKPDTLIISYLYTNAGAGSTGKANWTTTLVSYKSADQEPAIADTKPVADFSAAKNATNSKLYRFTNKSTSGLPMTYLWLFGDGNTSTEKDPTHTYATEGNFTVSLVATNSVGSSEAKREEISTRPTTADADDDYTPTGGISISFKDESAWGAFGGLDSKVVDNLHPGGINTTTKVNKITNNTTDAFWAGVSKIFRTTRGDASTAALPLDYSTKKIFKMKVYAKSAIGSVTMQLETVPNDNNPLSLTAAVSETVGLLFVSCNESASKKLNGNGPNPPAPPSTTDPNVPATKGVRKLVWNDEFKEKFDATKWEIMTGDGSSYGIPGWGNNEEQYYQGGNVSIANETLVITAKRENVGNKKFTSSRIRTKNKGDWSYGWFEARIKLPNATQGIWPAFWMLPTGGTRGWPADGEIDIMEWIGKDKTNLHGTIHYGTNGHEQKTFKTSDGTDLGGTWHVYAVEWTLDNIKWYLDDKEYASVSKSQTSSWPFNGAYFHILLNLAVGGNWPGATDATTTLPQTLEVDYVRVYQ
ncbi:hypothetical protein CHS0354_000626 [Potamilus streckersoni]|uniref:Uncharacterized protein n=1 Tax=Potamilus streckersoni TaxID=2493646 RepID=A0AAE0T6Z0_9BIVA|nr:hypothetical protein CHS0354_000626 [Potamilus streckersoni]